MQNINDTLAERGKTHGDYREHARITQELKNVMRATEGWERLSLPQRETLEMVAHKIGRALAGDPNHTDHWHDIAGYSQLIVNQLTPVVTATMPKAKPLVDVNKLEAAVIGRNT
jgi:hypothetical protein